MSSHYLCDGYYLVFIPRVLVITWYPTTRGEADEFGRKLATRWRLWFPSEARRRRVSWWRRQRKQKRRWQDESRLTSQTESTCSCWNSFWRSTRTSTPRYLPLNWQTSRNSRSAYCAVQTTATRKFMSFNDLWQTSRNSRGARCAIQTTATRKFLPLTSLFFWRFWYSSYKFN